jgi:prevent-host-death family protein
MEKTVSSQEAPERFSDLLRDVSGQGNRYVVEQDGVPLAAVVPISLYLQWKRRREDFFQQMQESAERAGLSEEDAMRRTEEAKQAVRNQRS